MAINSNRMRTTNCSFTGNAAAGAGGAVFLRQAHATLFDKVGVPGLPKSACLSFANIKYAYTDLDAKLTSFSSSKEA